MVATPASPFLQRVHGALLAELAPTVDLALKVAVCQAAGLRRAEIAAQTGADPNALRTAQGLLKRATTRLKETP
jgi:hypothetical protein